MGDRIIKAKEYLYKKDLENSSINRYGRKIINKFVIIGLGVIAILVIHYSKTKGTTVLMGCLLKILYDKYKENA
ncbi:MAG: hypothetical protein ACRC1T_04815 [Clostridium chrysemydis]|uniref:hypothetical protein n=1 Tax=Clostridium chrysemydis TaxID=2665504 RepID=UPI003F2EDC8D